MHDLKKMIMITMFLESLTVYKGDSYPIFRPTLASTYARHRRDHRAGATIGLVPPLLTTIAILTERPINGHL